MPEPSDRRPASSPGSDAEAGDGRDAAEGRDTAEGPDTADAIADAIRDAAERHAGGDLSVGDAGRLPLRELDSLTRTAILVDLEDRFEVALPDDELAHVETFDDLVRLVERERRRPR